MRIVPARLENLEFPARQPFGEGFADARRGDAVVPAPKHQRWNVDAMQAKAERLRERVSAEDQEELDRLTNRLRNALTDRRWEELGTASNELSDVLFYLEDA